MRLALTLTAAGSFIVYGWAIKAFFARPDGMPPRMLLLSRLAGMTAACHLVWLSAGPLARPPGPTVAAAIYATGLALFAWACHETWRRPLPLAFSLTSPAEFVRTGPFAFVRHPFYTAYALTWVAGVVATGSLVLTCLTAPIVSMYVHAARGERPSRQAME
jgi:protein-S-isoprenylcysteine O-methyltransferase Ste14